jgi:hypothetical protein
MKMFSFDSRQQSGFERLRDVEGHEHLLADDKHPIPAPQLALAVTRGPSWFATAAITICTAILSGLFGMWVAQHSRYDADAFAIQHTSQYCKSGHMCFFRHIADHYPAPIVKDVGVNYSLVRFQGSLLKQNDFKLDPGPEVDAAWKSLGADCMSFPIHIKAKMLTASIRPRSKNTSGRCSAHRPRARSSQDQGRIWWRLSGKR